MATTKPVSKVTNDNGSADTGVVVISLNMDNTGKVARGEGGDR